MRIILCQMNKFVSDICPTSKTAKEAGECLEWLYRHICRHCKELGIRRPRNKYADIADAYLSYCKKRKRKASRTRMLKRRMIRLLEKLLIQMDEIHRKYGTALRYTQDYQKRLSIIRKVLVQEKEMPIMPTENSVLNMVYPLPSYAREEPQRMNT